MSILAERKQKQKWSLNPRGKFWAEDANKFGQKMLEKMGWSHGKGLGAKEDGHTEPIKVSYKNDSQGMGYKESDNQWTEHEANFTALLETLGSKPKQSEIKLSSLEVKSQSSKARVHYKKFTRGKDLSRYSEKDLANIFGKKTLKEVNIQVKNEVEKSVDTKSDDQCENKNFSHGGLISEYFKKKLPGFGEMSGFVVGKNGVLRKADESDTEERPNFGFGFKQDVSSNCDSLNINRLEKDRTEESELDSELNTNFGFGFNQGPSESIRTQTSSKTSFISYINETSMEGESTRKKKKDKKRALDDSEENMEDTPSKKKKLSIKSTLDETSTKRKKEKSKKKNQESGLSNPAFDPMYSPSKVEKHILEPIEETVDESLNDTLNDTAGQIAEMFEVQVQIHSTDTPVKKSTEEIEGCSKKKKKRKDTPDAMNSSELEIEIASLDETINQKSEDEESSRKKKKKSKDFIEEMDISINTSNNEFKESKKKKKKRKEAANTESIYESLGKVESDISLKKKKSKSKQSEGIDNPFFENSLEEDQLATKFIENPYEIQAKPKKKKKKKRDENKDEFAIENPIFNAIDTADPQDQKNEEFEMKRKSKSKKKKQVMEEEGGISNPGLNLNDPIVEDCDLMLNICVTPVPTSTSRKEEQGSINKVKTLVERRKSVRFSDVTRERIIPCKEELEAETLDESRNIVELEGKLNDSTELSHIDKFIQKRKAKKKNKGLDNGAFDQQATSIEENITLISKTLDTFQAEIENDINETKAKALEIEDIMVGEVGNPDGTNEKLPDGSVKLKFKYANFVQTPPFLQNLTGPKRSYKNLIKGDIVIDFKETNLHEIEGYAVAKTVS